MRQSVSDTARLLKGLVFLTAALVWLGFTFASQVHAAVMPGGNSGWLVVASRPDANAAMAVANGYSNRFPQTTVFRSNNGWFAITIGWMPQPSGSTYKARLISSGAIPGDSYFHNGERFQYAVWSATGVTGGASQALFAATGIRTGGSGSSGSSTSFAYVTGLNPRGDNFLSLRTGPGTRFQEVARLRENTQLSVLGRKGSWVNVALTDGRSGWAYGKYIAAMPLSHRPPAPAAASAPADPPPAIASRAISPPRDGVVADLGSSGDDFLSLRTGAGTGKPEIARLLEGTGVKMLAQQGAWIEIELANGMRGWAYGRYLKAATSRDPAPQAVAPDIPIFGPEKDLDTGHRDGDTAGGPNLPDLSALPDGKRVALIIGNSAYEHAPLLPNPKNDAARLTATLKRLQFEVILGLDQHKAAMEGTIRTFVRSIQDADVVLFFYAGHAMQMDGRNFLVPVDAKLEDSTAVDFETIELATILDYMNAPGRLSIALLDACRDNPLARRFRTLGTSRSSFVKRGLAAPEAGGGNIMIGFATAPGDVALDGDGDNSPFTTALLKHIETPGLEIEIMMKRVKADVYAATQGTQSPWHNSALRREFYFLK